MNLSLHFPISFLKKKRCINMYTKTIRRSYYTNSQSAVDDLNDNCTRHGILYHQIMQAKELLSQLQKGFKRFEKQLQEALLMARDEPRWNERLVAQLNFFKSMRALIFDVQSKIPKWKKSQRTKRLGCERTCRLRLKYPTSIGHS